MSAAITHVNYAIGRYLDAMRQRGITDAYGVQAETLAAFVKCPRETMSEYLQRYRDAQRRGNKRCRYTIACEGYGPVARWRILSTPKSDPRRAQHARVDHLPYVTSDAVLRFIRDVVHEIEPGLQHAPDDSTIEALAAFATKQLTAVAEFVYATLKRDDGNDGTAGVPAA